MARDFSHLDHDALVSLGVTATGHRKRILRLVSHIQRREAQRANQRADLPCNASLHQSADGVSVNSDGNQPAMKPVPKPRTVFNRRRTAPVHFTPTVEPAGPAHRRLSQESICFTVLEGQATEATPTPADSHRPGQTPRTRPGRSLSLSDAVGSVPPVPPRLNRSAGASSSAERRLVSSLLRRPGSLDGTRLSGSSGTPRGGSLEMVSNEIYWGTNAAPIGGRSYCNQQMAPPTPPRNPDRNQNLNLDRNR